MHDYILRILSDDGMIRASAARTTNLVEKIRLLQGTDPTATVAVGRLASAAALFSSLLKGKQRLGLMIEGNGPLKKLQAETDAEGHVRASVREPVAGLPPKGGQYDVAGAVGKAGFLHVIKDLGLKEPYRGMVQLQSSEIGEDLAYYFTVSEQTPSGVGLGVTLSGYGSVAAAGGYLVQAMPGCSDEALALLEERLRSMPPLSTLVGKGGSPEELLALIMKGLPYHQKQKTELVFQCCCSRSRIESVLLGLGEQELHDAAEKEEELSVTCEYCRQTYSFSGADLRRIDSDKSR